MASATNKTDTFPIRMTPKLRRAIIKCAQQKNIKPTEWLRTIIYNAVQEQCPQAINQPTTEQGQ